ncbi:hypothetical protein CCACVL1_29364 [Corchorus capsularis]|uniref:Uncharacterized protein n=1 Tax=Corchorus capsularis TaxID=210143 RepID=A0A1R3G1Y9_COCAP|nr:hypothetical protein CCACVL1_29364 [Corchorus capsularis]
MISILQSHPYARGLRGKAFPHYDTLFTVFGTDMATGAGAEGPAEAVEAMDDEGESDEEEGNGDEDEGCDEVNILNDEDEPTTWEQTPYVNASNAELDGSVSKPPSNNDQNKKSVTSHKRTKSGDGFNELVQHIGTYVAAYQEKKEDFANYFKKESDEKERRRALIMKEIVKLENLTKQKHIKVGQYILKDEAKVDFFFGLPEEYRVDYVREQVSECAPYHPSFDFGGSQ